MVGGQGEMEGKQVDGRAHERGGAGGRGVIWEGIRLKE